MDHTVVHFEIPAKDVEKLRSFYNKLFGWKIEKSPMPMDYWTIQTVPVNKKMMPIRPGINGGLYKKERPELTSVNYITVESLDKLLKRSSVWAAKSFNQNKRFQP